MRTKKLILIGLVTVALNAQAVLDTFSSLRLNGEGDALWQVYTTTASGGYEQQSLSVSGGTLNVIGSPSGCTSSGSTGCAVYWHFLPRGILGYLYNSPCDSSNVGNCGYAQGWRTSGSWTVAYDRLRLEMICTKSVSRRSDGGDILQLGTYIRDKANNSQVYQGAHYYHLYDANFYANQPMVIEMSSHPQHQVGQDSHINWADDPEWGGTENVHYMDGLTRWYFVGLDADWSDQTCKYDNFTFISQPNTPNEYVSSVTITYNGVGYELAWASVKNQNVTYDVRHAASSMRSIGWTNGTSDGISANPGSDYVGVLKTVTMGQAAGATYWAVRPRMNVASATAATPIAITTGVGHSLNTGDSVSVASVCANANGTKTVTVTGRTTFTLDGTSGACSYSSGGTATTTSDTSGFYEVQFGAGSTGGGSGMAGKVSLNGNVTVH